MDILQQPIMFYVNYKKRPNYHYIDRGAIVGS